ncbi:hypothetical protein [Olivibacter sitiensis]|nr:hypothetical protein [Olivibacter sitiensis]
MRYEDSIGKNWVNTKITEYSFNNKSISDLDRSWIYLGGNLEIPWTY